MAEPKGRAALLAALDARATAGRPVRLWLRDDDAIEASPALSRLIALALEHRVAPVVAAIPQAAKADLAEAVAGSGARIAVHGIAHANWAPDGEKKRELGPDRPVETMLNALDAARARLKGLAGPAFIAMLVPPWNRIADAIVPHLASHGFTALSTFGPRAVGWAAPGVVRVNTHLDLIDWKGARATFPHDTLFDRLAGAIGNGDAGRDDEPIGILTHHLVHDAAAWRFLEDLMELTCPHPGAEWLAAGDVAGTLEGADARG